MSDYIVRAMAADASIRAFAITSKDIVETARKDHDTTPVMTAALGRLLSVGAMMGAMMKGDKDLLTLQIQCSGPAKGMTVTADSHGNVKGFALNPQVDLPLNSQGKLDVGGALDLGILSVIKDMGLKEPYVGQCQLQTGEIAEDLTYYFATSEQIPSAVGLGVLVDKDGSVKQAGGFILQLMPFTPDDVIEKLEKRIAEIDSVTQMLDRGLSPEQILEEIVGDFGLEITDTIDTAFNCDCSKEKVSRAIATISRKDLDDIINDGESIEVKCQFCNSAYKFDIDELKELRK
ncbi:MAG: Hsp33 family molecular chaperone HslO [Agathobacter sp.]|nr:Hsp33 family molecular chaperone HslO [Agathobacter sp.]